MRIVKIFKYFFYLFFCYSYYKLLFNKIGWKTTIVNPLKIQGASNIVLGSMVFIQYKTWLAALPLTKEKIVKLEIGDNSIIGNFNHIFATKSIVIGKGVLTADKVYIADNTHNYHDINSPILNQSIKQLNEVVIGDGSWIGENVCIIGAKIGKQCVIGANSVVNKDRLIQPS